MNPSFGANAKRGLAGDSRRKRQGRRAWERALSRSHVTGKYVSLKPLHPRRQSHSAEEMSPASRNRETTSSKSRVDSQPDPLPDGEVGGARHTCKYAHS